jgi:glucose/arabinose dehydrogenase
MTRVRVLALAAAPLAGAALLPMAQAAEPPSKAAQPTAATRAAAPSVGWSKVSGRFNQPVQVVAAPDGTSRLFVVQKGGLVRVWSRGKVLARPYLNIEGRVRDDGERGLLSIAFSPNFKARPFVYAAYSRSDGDLVVARFRASGAKSARLNRASQKIVLRVEHSTYSNHNGGQLMFGPDRMLYLGVGDGGGGGDPFGSGQSRDTLLGKILRIDVSRSCGRQRYCVPSGNPFAGPTPGRGEIWAMGVRNPWRFSFDPVTKNLWIGDVGQDSWEEVDRLGPNAAGANLGWSCWEARSKYNASQCRAGASYEFPVVAIAHPTAESITGGFVYRGSRWPSLRGQYVFGDFITGRIWTYRPGQGKTLQARRLGSVTSFGVDDRNEMWAVTIDGGLWRMKVS